MHASTPGSASARRRRSRGSRRCSRCRRGDRATRAGNRGGEVACSRRIAAGARPARCRPGRRRRPAAARRERRGDGRTRREELAGTISRGRRWCMGRASAPPVRGRWEIPGNRLGASVRKVQDARPVPRLRSGHGRSPPHPRLHGHARARARPPARRAAVGDGNAGRRLEARSRPTATPTAATAGGSSPTCAIRRASPAARCTRSRSSSEVAPATSPAAARCATGSGRSRCPTAALPFALPVATRPGTAPWWRGRPAEVVAADHAPCRRDRAPVAAHDPAVAGHPWLPGDAVLPGAIAALAAPRAPRAAFYARPARRARRPPGREADPELERLGARAGVGALPVEGGTEDEALRPLDLSPEPGRPAARRCSAPRSSARPRPARGRATRRRRLDRRLGAGLAGRRAGLARWADGARRPDAEGEPAPDRRLSRPLG